MKYKTSKYTLKEVQGHTILLRNITNTYTALETDDFLFLREKKSAKIKVFFREERSNIEKKFEKEIKSCKALDALFNSTIIPEKAFAFQKTLSSIIIGENIIKISKQSFSNCKNLKEVILPDSLKEIEYGAFEKCDALVRLQLPDNIKEIQENVFNGCSSLKSIKYKGKVYTNPDELNNKLINDKIAINKIWTK